MKLDELEAWVNNAIAADVPIVMEEMSVEDAKAKGAVGIFTSKYSDVVKVYTAGRILKRDMRRATRKKDRRTRNLQDTEGTVFVGRGKAHPRGARIRM